MNLHNFQNHSLFDILSIEQTSNDASLNLYVLALSKSRTEPLTEAILNIVYDLYIHKDIKWLEIVNRSLNNNFIEGYNACIKTFHFYRSIIGLVFQQNVPQKQEQILNLVKSMIIQINIQGDSRSLCVIVETVNLLIQKIMQNQRWNLANNLLQFLCNNPFCLNKCIHALINPNIITSQINDTLVLQKYSYQFIRFLSWMFAKLQQLSIHSLYLLKFQAQTLPVQQFLSNTFNQVLISRFPQKISIYLQASRSGYKPHSQMNIIYDSCCAMIKGMSYISMINCLWVRLLPYISDTNTTREMIKIFITTDLVYLNRTNDYQRQFVVLNYQLISGKFSDTLAGQFSTLIAILCQNFGNFINIYTNQIIGIFNQEVQLASSNKYEHPIHNLLMKLCIPSVSLKERASTLSNILNSIFNSCFADLQHGQFKIPITDIDKLQILFFMMAFSEHINENIICFCLRLCFRNMKQIYFEQLKRGIPAKQIQDNFWFSHSYDLLVIMTDKEHICQIFNKNLGQICEQLLSLPLTIQNNNTTNIEIPNKFYKIYLRFVDKFKQVISRSSHQILKQLSKAFDYEVRRVWDLHRKISPQIRTILQILDALVKDQSEQQFSYQQITQYLLSVISYLQNPFRIEFEDELIQILASLIQKHKFFSPEVVIIFIKLRGSVQKNEGKLTILNKIYEAMSVHDRIIEQISFDSQQIVQIFLGMAINYISNFLIEEYMLYKMPVVQFFDALQVFIDAYKDIIQQSYPQLINQLFSQTKQQVLKLNEDTSLGQIRKELKETFIETSMVICHACPSKSIVKQNQIMLKSINLKDYNSLRVMCQIPICLIDYLMFWPEEYQKILTQITYFYMNVKDVLRFYSSSGYPQHFLYECNKQLSIKSLRTQNQLKEKKKHKIWPQRPRQYIQNAIRELRNKKIIDQLTHSEFLSTISKIFI